MDFKLLVRKCEEFLEQAANKTPLYRFNRAKFLLEECEKKAVVLDELVAELKKVLKEASDGNGLARFAADFKH